MYVKFLFSYLPLCLNSLPLNHPLLLSNYRISFFPASINIQSSHVISSHKRSSKMIMLTESMQRDFGKVSLHAHYYIIAYNTTFLLYKHAPLITKLTNKSKSDRWFNSVGIFRSTARHVENLWKRTDSAFHLAF